MKTLLILFVTILLVAGAPAVYAEKSGYGFWVRDKEGVGAKAVAYESVSSVSQGSQATSSDASSMAATTGPLLVPLVSQVDCGHDPRWAGGQTCALAPPPDINLERPRQRPRRPSPEEIAQQLRDRAIALAPRPVLRITPGRRGLTGLASYFWLRERPRTIQARASVFGLVVTAEARPIQYVWTFGDGSDRVTTHHGRRWTRTRRGNISHTYETKRRYTVRVEVIWEARWRVGFQPWRPLGYFSNSDSDRYRVRELKPVLVPYR